MCFQNVRPSLWSYTRIMPWIPKTSRSTGRTYYYNTDTKETSWKRPNKEKSTFMVRDDKSDKSLRDDKSDKSLRDDKSDVTTDNLQPTVSDAYSQIANRDGKTARKATSIIRRWNNLIKRHLIDNVLRYRIHGLKVLDLCCGRGGDMGKILQYKCVKRYRGIDISDGAIREAIQRSSVHNQHGTVLDFFVADVLQATPWNKFSVLERDATPNDPIYHVLNLNELTPWNTHHHFSLINTQYALHYMCKTKKNLMAFLKRVADSLDPGPFGAWIGTVPSAMRIQQAINGTYSLPSTCTITPSTRWRGNGRLGDPYIFYLEGCVPRVEEFLLPKEVFIDLASKCGLENILYQNAGDYLVQQTEARIQDGSSNHSKKDYEHHKTPLEWQVTSLYDVFMFRLKTSS
jgi:SAM-dependent methyltransferase